MQTKRLIAGALELEVRERGGDPPGGLTANDVDIRFDGKAAAVRGLRYSAKSRRRVSIRAII
jgi:hypothetical protein